MRTANINERKRNKTESHEANENYHSENVKPNNKLQALFGGSKLLANEKTLPKTTGVNLASTFWKTNGQKVSEGGLSRSINFEGRGRRRVSDAFVSDSMHG